MGIDYVVFHEDAFPEKVSVFPAAWTLQSLLTHPRLSMLDRDRGVWAFQIEAEPPAGSEVRVVESEVYPPSRCYEMERHVTNRFHVVDEASSRQGYARLPVGETATIDVYTPRAPSLRWLLRWRGPGRVVWRSLLAGSVLAEGELAPAGSNRWQWSELPVGLTNDYAHMELTLDAVGDTADLDLCLLTAGNWARLAPGESLRIRPADLFRAGYTVRETGAVCMNPRYESNDVILYGPRLPLEPGRYELAFNVNSEAGLGMPLGDLWANAGARNEPPLLDVRVTAGQPMRWPFEVTRDLPFSVWFRYAAETAIEIVDITLTRVE